MIDGLAAVWEASERPLYNIQAVVTATGVPAPTLRSWERRHGVPAPKHDERGYRLYSDRDIAMTRWLQARGNEGVAVSRAVAMLREMKPGSPQPDTAADPTSTNEIAACLLSAIRTMDEARASAAIASALQSVPVEEVLLHVLQPALYRVGDLWAAGELSVTAERFGSNLVRGYVAQLMHLAPPPLWSERILVGCAPGEQHDLGPLMLALFLRRTGFDVIYAGANLEAESLMADVRRLSPAALCLGASTSLTVPPLATLFGGLQDTYDGILTFGGQAFIQNPELIDAVPGHYLGPDAVTAAVALRKELADSRHK